jgi:hypothetical protein
MRRPAARSGGADRGLGRTGGGRGGRAGVDCCRWPLSAAVLFWTGQAARPAGRPPARKLPTTQEEKANRTLYDKPSSESPPGAGSSGCSDADTHAGDGFGAKLHGRALARGKRDGRQPATANRDRRDHNLNLSSAFSQLREPKGPRPAIPPNRGRPLVTAHARARPLWHGPSADRGSAGMAEDSAGAASTPNGEVRDLMSSWRPHLLTMRDG